MALISDILKSNITENNVFTWLTTGVADEDLSTVLPGNDKSVRDCFPFLLLSFIKEEVISVLKVNNAPPKENSVIKEEVSPEKDLLHYPVNNKNAETRKIRKKVGYSIDLQDEKNFPPLHTVQEPNRRRRINPTHLSTVTDSASEVSKFGTFLRSPNNKSTNPFNQAKEQTSSRNLDQERELLKEHKKQTIHQTITEIGSSPKKNWSCIEPDISCVTKKAELDKLSNFYAFCLNQHLIPSLYSEVEQLMELLLLRISSTTVLSSKGYLNSVHNCVYFSASTLSKLENVWEYLDQALLRLLIENPRLVRLSPEFVNKLSVMTSLLKGVNSRLGQTRTVGNVSFQFETDNRFNFASDSSFHAFRKQRDQFCEIWQLWKQNSSSPDWDSSSLQRMIKSLVGMKPDYVNYVHLSRLFLSQLLNVAQLFHDDEDNGPLRLLRHSDPQKLRRLRERLVNPSESRGKVNVIFEGDQEFFKDFIVLADSPAFNEHLKNSLVQGMVELNQSLAVHEDCDGYGQLSEKILVLRVLAKFLALINFLPYGSSDHLPEHIFHEMIQLRANQRPPLDLLLYVDDAFRNGKLIVTLPWVVTFLSFADPVTLCLPHFYSVLCYLVVIYKEVGMATNFHGGTWVLIRLLLSWLFDQTHFPRSLLNKSPEELRSEIEKYLPKIGPTSPTAPDAFLDQIPLVDSILLYQCCPFLLTWRNLLSDFALGMKWSEKKAVSRKITPISAEDPPPNIRKNIAQASQSLQLILEESFFHNQPSSVKRTVDFVSDRLASNVVRNVRHEIIPAAAAQGQTTVKLWPCNSQRIEEKLETLSSQLCSYVRKQAAAQLVNSLSVSLDSTLSFLLPSEVLPQVRQLCVAIATRYAREKVSQWVNRHVTVALFQNDLAAIWNKLEKRSSSSPCSSKTTVLQQPHSLLASSTADQLHDPTTLSPSMLVDILKKGIRDIIQDATKYTADDVNNILIHLKSTLQRRSDVASAVFKCLLQLSFDFLFILCVFQPDVIALEAIELWVDFWQQFYKVDQSIKNLETADLPATTSVWLIFVPKHLLLLAQSMSPRLSWNHVTSLVLHLLKNELISFKEIEEQAITIIRQSWPQDLLQKFATCLRDIVDWQRRQLHLKNGCIDDEEQLIDAEILSWLSWFCSQADQL